MHGSALIGASRPCLKSLSRLSGGRLTAAIGYGLIGDRLRRGHGSREATSGAVAGALRRGLGPAEVSRPSFYTAPNRLLAENGFDPLIERLCAPLHRNFVRPGVPPGCPLSDWPALEILIQSV